jgi:N utilization substance protein A
MEVVVEDKQLSLAIGKKGQNVRLAAKLTGWRIDIKSEEEKRREVEAQFGALEATPESPEDAYAAAEQALSGGEPARAEAVEAADETVEAEAGVETIDADATGETVEEEQKENA